jgi:exonuclease VII small subunit
MGLCFKVEAGDIPLDEAISIFENARHTLIQQRQEEKQEKKHPAPL